jgi:ABC-type sugar transport system permease subunit
MGSKREQWLWWLFLAPAILLLLLFMAWPLFQAMRLSLFEWKGLTPPRWVGFDNFVTLASDRYFWAALQHTLIFAVVATFGTVALGLVLAIAISRRVPGHRIYKFAFYLPVMIPITVAAALWVRLLEPNYGIVNSALRGVGLGFLAAPWLADLNLSLWTVIAVVIWGSTGFPMIVLLASIEAIAEDLHEAMTLDGVNAWQRVWHLILPLVRPVLISITALQLIFSLKVFDIIWVMTRGGPAESTSVLGTYLYRMAFEQQKFGYASAVAVVMFVLIFSVTYAYYKISRFGEE